MSERLAELGVHSLSGLGLRGHSDWLVVPIALRLHSLGPEAIDGQMGVRAWEAKYRTQAELLDEVSEQVGYSVWDKHVDWVRSTSRVTSRARRSAI